MKGVSESRRKKNIGITVAATLMICLMCFFLVQIMESYFEEGISETDLIYFEGNLISSEAREEGGLRKHRKLFFKLHSEEILFKISNTSLRLLDEESFRICAKTQAFIRIATSPNELNQYNEKKISDKILNLILDGRINPQVYSITCGEKTLLDYKEVIKADRRLAISNMYFGAPFLVIGIAFFGLIIYANWKE